MLQHSRCLQVIIKIFPLPVFFVGYWSPIPKYELNFQCCHFQLTQLNKDRFLPVTANNWPRLVMYLGLSCQPVVFWLSIVVLATFLELSGLIKTVITLFLIILLFDWGPTGCPYALLFGVSYVTMVRWLLQDGFVYVSCVAREGWFWGSVRHWTPESQSQCSFAVSRWPLLGAFPCVLPVVFLNFYIITQGFQEWKVETIMAS